MGKKPGYLGGIPPEDPPTEYEKLNSLILAIHRDLNSRLGRIERNQIAHEQAACAASPEFRDALNALRTANMKKKDPA